LRLKQKIRLSHDVYDFVFALDKPINFTPGQYMEFTFEHPGTDDRGNRRYLSLASSPTEADLRVGVKFENPPSSYKRNLFEITSNQKVAAGQLIGDFTLPKDPTRKLVFIAGGIGITPFRSMIKYLIDKNERRDIVVIYVAKNPDDFVYKDVLEAARTRLGVRTFYIASSVNGHLDANSIANGIPDYAQRFFYLSGSHNMVTSFEEVLKNLNIPGRQIITDYFPGFA
jgi:ferredoxin-NADP reductase